MTATTRPHSPTRGALIGPEALDDDRGADLSGWRTLLATARHPNPFHGPDLLVPALRHLADGDRVRLLVVPEPGPGSQTPSTGLILPVATRQRFRRLPWRVSTGWQHTHHFLGTPLVSAGFGVEGWRGALAHLERHGPDPLLLLPNIDVDIARDVEEAARADGRTTRRTWSGSRATTRRRPSDDYLERQLSGSRRKELRRVRRRLSERVGGDLTLHDLVSAGRLEEGIETFLRVEAAGWKGADGGAIDRSPRQRSYFVESCRALAEHGGLEILALQGGREGPVAMAVNLVTDTTLFTCKIAYDEQHSAYSPGLLLYLEQLHRFHDSGAALLDTCAEPAHPMANRLHPDRRELVTLAVGLRGERGDRMVRAIPRLLRAEEHARELSHSMRRRVARQRHRADAPPATAPPPTGTNATGEPR